MYNVAYIIQMAQRQGGTSSLKVKHFPISNTLYPRSQLDEFYQPRVRKNFEKGRTLTLFNKNILSTGTHYSPFTIKLYRVHSACVSDDVVLAAWAIRRTT